MDTAPVTRDKTGVLIAQPDAEVAELTTRQINLIRDALSASEQQFAKMTQSRDPLAMALMDIPSMVAHLQGTMRETRLLMNALGPKEFEPKGELPPRGSA